jgi:hypothetical protein
MIDPGAEAIVRSGASDQDDHGLDAAQLAALLREVSELPEKSTTRTSSER